MTLQPSPPARLGASPPRRLESFSTKPVATPTPASDLANVALDIAYRNGRVTADDLRQLTPNAPNKSANYGAAFRILVQQGRLVLDHYEASQASHNNGRRIGVYTPPYPRACP